MIPMKKRRLFALLLTLVMTLSLAACGSQETPSAQEQPDAAESSEAAGSGETPTVIRVGMECAYAPNNWQEDTQSEYNVPIENLPGFYADGNDVQIARHIADELGAVLPDRGAERRPDRHDHRRHGRHRRTPGIHQFQRSL